MNLSSALMLSALKLGELLWIYTFMRMEPGTEPCGSGFIIHTKYHLIVLVSTRLTPMLRSLHVNSSEIHCVIPMTDVFEHVLGGAVVAVYTRFLTYRRADSISTKAGL